MSNGSKTVKAQSFRPNSTLRALLAVTWLGLAIVFLVWQSLSYRGLLALLAECRERAASLTQRAGVALD